VAIFVEVESFEFWKGQSDSTSITRGLIRKGFVPIARDREYGDHQFNILFVRADKIGTLTHELCRAYSPLRCCLVSGEELHPTRSETLTRRSFSLGVHFQTQIPIIIPVFNSLI